MAITVNTDVTFASGPSIGLAAVSGAVCLTIHLNGQTAAVPITRQELAKLIQMGQAALPLFEKIAL